MGSLSPVQDAPPQRQHLGCDLGQIVEAAKREEAIGSSRHKQRSTRDLVSSHLFKMRPHSASTWGVIFAKLLKLPNVTKPFSKLRDTSLSNLAHCGMIKSTPPVQDAPPQRQHLRWDLGQVVEAAKRDKNRSAH
jgi:hypothetical protein